LKGETSAGRFQTSLIGGIRQIEVLMAGTGSIRSLEASNLGVAVRTFRRLAVVVDANQPLALATGNQAGRIRYAGSSSRLAGVGYSRMNVSTGDVLDQLAASLGGDFAQTGRATVVAADLMLYSAFKRCFSPLHKHCLTSEYPGAPG